jgi:hypothetical protein
VRHARNKRARSAAIDPHRLTDSRGSNLDDFFPNRETDVLQRFSRHACDESSHMVSNAHACCSFARQSDTDVPASHGNPSQRRFTMPAERRHEIRTIVGPLSTRVIVDHRRSHLVDARLDPSRKEPPCRDITVIIMTTIMVTITTTISRRPRRPQRRRQIRSA